jgi:uncharacterized protein (DUF433 family)
MAGVPIGTSLVPVLEYPMSVTKSYVRTDEHGVMRVGATRVMLDSVVSGFEQGCSPEAIRQQFPALSLEEVYGSIAYFLCNQEEVSIYLQQQNVLWKEWQARCEQQPAPVVERLRAMRRGGAGIVASGGPFLESII